MKAVIFDLDETLIHSKIDFKKMKTEIIDFLQRVGVTPGLLNDNMLNFEITRLAVENLREKGLPEDEIRRVLAKITLIMNHVELEAAGKAAVMDGALETLKSLKALGLKIGVLTNSCREYVEKVLAIVGLSGFVDAVAARDDVKEPKPNSEHAFHLLRLLGVSADEALLVGDHWLDAECAKRAGLIFVLLERRDQNLEALKKYDYQPVKNIRDVVKIVKSAIVKDASLMPKNAQ